MAPSHCIDRPEKNITDWAKNNNFRPKESELVVVYNLQSLVERAPTLLSLPGKN